MTGLRSILNEIRLPGNEEPIAAVTILDGNGAILRIVPATAFRRSPPTRPRPAAVRRVTPPTDDAAA